MCYCNIVERLFPSVYNYRKLSDDITANASRLAERSGLSELLAQM